MRKIIGLSLAISLVLTAIAAVPAAAAKFYDIDGDAILVGDNTIVGTVTGDVTNVNGELTIEGDGKVLGDIRQIGSGGVVVDTLAEDPDKSNRACDARTRVVGNIVERHSGNIHVRDCSTVDGNLYERGDGEVAVARESTVTGNVHESASGKTRVAVSSMVEGDLFEKGSGDAQVLANSTVKGDLSEQDSGCVAISSNSSVLGAVTGNPC